MDSILFTLIGILVVGILAQWLAWRLNVPSILLLLLSGIVVGPVTGLVDPDRLLGDLLLPLVSLSVAIILYEGGLSLRLRELRQVGAVVRNLITMGSGITWLGGAMAARICFGFQWSFALLTGALFIVTGPTVIGPMLRQIRPSRDVATALKWEGIVSDPLGVMVAVLVLESILHSGSAGSQALVGMGETLVMGGLLGVAGAWILALLLRRHLLPDFLQSPWSLMMVFVVYGACERVQADSGLFAVTLMGVVLANRRDTDIRHIIEFKENLQVLLLSILFIVLSARLDSSFLSQLSWAHLAFLGLLMLVVRPIAVFVSTLRTSFSLSERIFLCCVAPRGIVSAAMASVVALALGAQGHPQAGQIVPLAFFVIIGTVILYGLGAPLAARALGVAADANRGVLILGAHTWARAMAQALQEAGCDLMLVDVNRQNIAHARMDGLAVSRENILAEGALEDLDLSGKGVFLALTSNDEVNALACLRMEELFGRSNVYQLVAEEESEGATELELGGRRLFREEITYRLLQRRFRQGWRFKVTRISEEFDLESYRELYGEEVPLLFVVDEQGRLRVDDAKTEITPKLGDRLVGFVRPDQPASAQSSETSTPRR